MSDQINEPTEPLSQSPKRFQFKILHLLILITIVAVLVTYFWLDQGLTTSR